MDASFVCYQNCVQKAQSQMCIYKLLPGDLVSSFEPTRRRRWGKFLSTSLVSGEDCSLP